MIKRVLLGTALVLALLTGACGSSASSTSSTGAAAQSSLQASAVITLSVGTVKLESTDLKVDAVQAAKLKTLWQAYRTLSQDSGVSQVEITALVQQIEAAMSSAQMQAIQGMGLNSQDLAGLMEQMNVDASAGAASGVGAKSSSKGQGAAAGGGPAGGMPDMGGGGAPPGDVTGGGQAPSASGTVVQSGSVASSVPVAFLDALIRMLETKI